MSLANDLSCICRCGCLKLYIPTYTSFAHSVTKLKIVLLIKNTSMYVPRLAFFDIKKSHLGFDSTFFSMSLKKLFPNLYISILE